MNNNVGYIPNIQQTQAPIQPQTTQVNNGVHIPVDAQKANAPAQGSAANGVNIIIYNPSVNPNGANINNTVNNTSPGQAYPQVYYTTQPGQTPQPLAAGGLKSEEKSDKKLPQKDIVQLTDEYVQTLENYLRNPNPDIKLQGAKELMKRFREDESRKNDIALTNLLNLTLQSKYSPVKMIGMTIISNGWASGDDFSKQLLAQIQGSKGSYGLDALDASEAALKSAGKTIKVVDNDPKKANEKDEKARIKDIVKETMNNDKKAEARTKDMEKRQSESKMSVKPQQPKAEN